MTATELGALAGVLLSLAFSYVPGLNTKYAGWTPEVKRLVMLGALVLAAVGVYGVGCLGWLDTGIACTVQGALDLLKVLVVAVVANQGVYSISPQPLSVREAKLDRLP